MAPNRELFRRREKLRAARGERRHRRKLDAVSAGQRAAAFERRDAILGRVRAAARLAFAAAIATFMGVAGFKGSEKMGERLDDVMAKLGAEIVTRTDSSQGVPTNDSEHMHEIGSLSDAECPECEDWPSCAERVPKLLAHDLEHPSQIKNLPPKPPEYIEPQETIWGRANSMGGLF